MAIYRMHEEQNRSDILLVSTFVSLFALHISCIANNKQLGNWVSSLLHTYTYTESKHSLAAVKGLEKYKQLRTLASFASCTNRLHPTKTFDGHTIFTALQLVARRALRMDARKAKK